MLKTRVITAVILAPLALALIFFTTLEWFGLLFALLLLIGSWEFRQLGGLQRKISGWLMVVIQAVLFFALFTISETIFLHLSFASVPYTCLLRYLPLKASLLGGLVYQFC